MDRQTRIIVVSDVHYACGAEQARGNDYELKTVRSTLGRFFLTLHRKYVWLREPLNKGYLLDDFLAKISNSGGFLVSNGDHSCDSGFIGVADEAAFGSVRECVSRMRSAYGENFAAVWGDHDLGKRSFIGNAGGMRLKSAERLLELGLPPFWRREFGSCVLIGVASSLLAWEAFQSEALPEEHEGWRALREEHLRSIRVAFESLQPSQRVILFCHDPTALPFLMDLAEVRSRIHQVDCTVIGHLHSPFILKLSKVLAGMPEITSLGHTVRKLTRALGKARSWKPFNVVLCPSLAGIELFKDGGFSELTVEEKGPKRVRFIAHRLPRRNV